MHLGYQALMLLAGRGDVPLDRAEFLRKCLNDVLTARARSKAPTGNVVVVQNVVPTMPRVTVDVQAQDGQDPAPTATNRPGLRGGS